MSDAALCPSVPTAAAPGTQDVPLLQELVQAVVLRASQRSAESPAVGRDEEDVSEQDGHADEHP